MANKLMKKCLFSLEMSKIQNKAHWENKTIKLLEKNIKKILCDLR